MGIGVITLIILMVVINPLELDFNEFGVKFTGLFAGIGSRFTGLFSGDSTSEEAETLDESSAETTSTTSVVTTSTSTTPVTTTPPATTTPQTTTSVSTTTTTVPELDHVVFSEVYYDAEGGPEEEWFELYNPTDDSIDLSGLTIKDNSGSYEIPEGTVIDDNEFLVMAKNETAFENLYGYLPDLNYSGLSLADLGDYLILKNGSEEIDMVAWEEGDRVYPEWNIEADEGESIRRDPPDRDTNTENDWESHMEPNPDIGGLITTSTTTTTSTSTTTIPTSTSTSTSTTTTSTTTSSSTSTTTSPETEES